MLEIARPALAGPGRENLPLERQENKMPSPAKGIDIKGKQHRETSARIPMTRERGGEILVSIIIPGRRGRRRILRPVRLIVIAFGLIVHKFRTSFL